jgi:hypothetical protein
MMAPTIAAAYQTLTAQDKSPAKTGQDVSKNVFILATIFYLQG